MVADMDAPKDNLLEEMFRHYLEWVGPLVSVEERGVVAALLVVGQTVMCVEKAIDDASTDADVR